MKIAIVAVIALALCGCDADEVSGKILCDPQYGKAYFMRHNVGNALFVYRVPEADVICKKAAQ